MINNTHWHDIWQRAICVVTAANGFALRKKRHGNGAPRSFGNGLWRGLNALATLWNGKWIRWHSIGDWMDADAVGLGDADRKKHESSREWYLKPCDSCAISQKFSFPTVYAPFPSAGGSKKIFENGKRNHTALYFHNDVVWTGGL